MSMAMTEKGHVVHAMSMCSEEFFLAWGDLGESYIDPWELGGDIPPALSVATEEVIVRGSGGSDVVRNPQIITDGVKRVYAGATEYTLGTDYIVNGSSDIVWGQGGSQPANGTPYTVIYRYFDPNVRTLVHEIGRRVSTPLNYVIEDPSGDIVVGDGTWKIVTQAQAEITSVTCLMASDLSGGEYFEIDTREVKYYVWFIVDGVGVNPTLPRKTGILVDLLSTDGAIAVATKLATAVNLTSNLVATQQLATVSPYAINETVYIEAKTKAKVHPTLDVTTGFGFSVISKGTEFPTRTIYAQFKFDALDGMNSDIYQLGLFVGTVRGSSVPLTKKYLIPSDISDPGFLYIIENVEPFPRSPGKREIFELVFNF